ncbi:hypothetical protein B1813_02900 [Saccharomonospora piscinae]|uniref:Uncharacterized protein n=1 Tax=Saccharomonospora piscinae TaxID=687388 RepID=A0A1V9ADM5_SACPI|nr:DUF6518 family protein [Saccharomonospora piscinae]OQO95024.1 hypothetical protein B1813_02900 [Saccharomonospora piscinae]
MEPPEPAATPRTPAGPGRLPLRPELLVALAGLLTGVFAAVAYYSPLLRSLAHTFVIWTALAAVVAAGQSARTAVVRVSIALLAAVSAFYSGKAVVYSGGALPLNLFDLLVWGGLAVVAGVVLGLGLRAVGDSGAHGTVATASALGLMWGDVVRRTGHVFPPDPALVAVTGLLTAVLLLLGSRSRAQAARIALLAVPLTVPGFLLVSAPDLLEQLLITGSFSGGW